MKIRFSHILMAGALFVGVGEAAANVIPVPGNARFNIKTKSLVDMRFKQVIRQAYDLSCGAAAVATLMKYYYSEKTDEKQVIDTIFKFGDKDKIQKAGFSMLELKKYGERRGYVSQGFRIPKVENLKKLKVPVLTLINTRGYNHFVVIKGVKNGQVYIADPAFGNISKSLEEFEEGWGNVILVFLSATNGGDNAFKLDPSLRARKSEVILLLDRGLYNVRPAANEY